MKRRQFLATTTALSTAVLAGCGHPPVVLDMDEATDSDIANEVSTSLDPESDAYAVIESAVENGSATDDDRRQLFDKEETVQFDGVYYAVSVSEEDSTDVTVYTVHVEFDSDEPTAERGAIAFEDLPETDRDRLEPAIPDPDETTGEDIARAIEYGTAADVENESVFVPDQEYDVIVQGEDRYRVTVDTRTTTESTYRYEVTEVADSTTEFAESAREMYLAELTGLSDAEREVVEEAIDDGYFDDDDAFRSVVEKIREHDAIREADFYGTWLLEYEDTAYLTYVEW